MRRRMYSSLVCGVWNPRVEREVVSTIPSILPPSLSTVAVLGVPLDTNSSFLAGCAKAPDAIRAAFHSDSANGFSEDGTDLTLNPSITDLGNLLPAKASMSALSSAAMTVLAHDQRLLTLGGDHSITYPLVRGVRRALVARGETRLNLLHLDAHSDLYEHDVLNQGNRYSHASPFARILEDGLVSRLVQVGIRTHTAHTRMQATAYGVETHEMRHLDAASSSWTALLDGGLHFDGPLYVSIDLDVLDPAFAPGVSHYEPGGMTTRQVLSLLHRLRDLRVDLVAADIVELNPSRDVGATGEPVTGQPPPGMTAMVAAKLAKELLSHFVALK
ncbi:Aste57867_7366 [Aphanomyces stellatus]|uniref:Aste57867_7366 protein n=1 Tax=Aphanomyces stellatus TaxID=120398 RepID=A0A485KI86_9STRA|nr:hypothetical protein As57867_007340 [Aphanomyces stellatus]VFT84283.1 Aste57867_7366 [Aphanomyces stellatus]